MQEWNILTIWHNSWQQFYLAAVVMMVRFEDGDGRNFQAQIILFLPKVILLVWEWLIFGKLFIFAKAGKNKQIFPQNKLSQTRTTVEIEY